MKEGVIITNIPVSYDTLTLVINLFKNGNKTHASIQYIQKLLEFIYTELKMQAKLDNYQISFDLNTNALKRTAIYHSNILGMDINEENIYLRSTQDITSLAAQYLVDDVIRNIIVLFLNNN